MLAYTCKHLPTIVSLLFSHSLDLFWKKLMMAFKHSSDVQRSTRRSTSTSLTAWRCSFSVDRISSLEKRRDWQDTGKQVNIHSQFKQFWTSKQQHNWYELLNSEMICDMITGIHFSQKLNDPEIEHWPSGISGLHCNNVIVNEQHFCIYSLKEKALYFQLNWWL